MNWQPVAPERGLKPCAEWWPSTAGRDRRSGGRRGEWDLYWSGDPEEDDERAYDLDLIPPPGFDITEANLVEAGFIIVSNL